MAVDSSVIIVTQDIIAPDRIPLAIIGTVILKKAFSLLEPKEIAASSIDIEICCRVAVEDLIV